MFLHCISKNYLSIMSCGKFFPCIILHFSELKVMFSNSLFCQTNNPKIFQIQRYSIYSGVKLRGAASTHTLEPANGNFARKLILKIVDEQLHPYTLHLKEYFFGQEVWMKNQNWGERGQLCWVSLEYLLPSRLKNMNAKNYKDHNQFLPKYFTRIHCVIIIQHKVQ